MRAKSLIAILLATVCLAGCSRFYYASMKKIGKEKRDILADRILSAKKDQERAKEQIQTAMEAFQDLTGFQGGDLERVYKKLNGEYEEAAARARKVSERVDSIEKVSGDLFKEWETEIASVSDRDLRRQSRQMLAATRKQQVGLVRKMRAVEARMKPVIGAFHDKVIFLKHNLNARAIASLKTTSVEMDREVADLVAEIEASVREADAFIATLQAE